MADPGIANPEELLRFWFGDEAKPRWFDSTQAFDDLLRDRYLTTWEAARDGALDAWAATPRGALALVIVLDQLPLNMFRDSPRSFETEAAARAVAEQAIAKGFDRKLDDEEKGFLYMPLMHSESLDDQERAVRLYREAGLDTRWPEHHRGIIRRFGRFPHRNAILGRESTPEEQAWLDSDEAFTG
ncbi:MAG: DUF924 family protein [Gammaproteobacteria bacterium]|nr:DUF924 family protein [Gammaproteobacteria bacterium]